MQQERPRCVVQTAPEDVPSDARVWDYDELRQPTQREFLRAVDGGDAAPIPEVAAVPVEPGDVVVFTDYFRVR